MNSSEAILLGLMVIGTTLIIVFVIIPLWRNKYKKTVERTVIAKYPMLDYPLKFIDWIEQVEIFNMAQLDKANQFVMDKRMETGRYVSVYVSHERIIVRYDKKIEIEHSSVKPPQNTST